MLQFLAIQSEECLDSRAVAGCDSKAVAACSSGAVSGCIAQTVLAILPVRTLDCDLKGFVRGMLLNLHMLLLNNHWSSDVASHVGTKRGTRAVAWLWLDC